ncbi:MAG: CDP-diacylglycerol--glycerol-3-phosphate 3-phosphatidyltransferase [Ignavibacteriota bacterium]|nr:CDP-diacylglycerol--glycerol-3-phosphate 3-phosphatidyltransferase [Ignavibacteriota bacterium]
MKKEILYISNQVSILRVLLVIPLMYLLINQSDSNTIIIAAILVAMYVSDLLDGYLARKLNQVSELGKIIDPLADKIAVVSIVIILYLQGRVETWFFIVVIARDLLIILFGLYLKSKNKIVLMSNYPGKAAVFSIGIIILLTVFNTGSCELLKNVISYLYYISVILIIYSLYLYLMRFYKSIGD